MGKPKRKNLARLQFLTISLHREGKLKEFLDIFNCSYPRIDFTSTCSMERIDFLDVEINKQDNRLLTGVFVKSTNTRQYIHATSCHVYHPKKFIPYGQVLHFNRICSENQFFDRTCNDTSSMNKIPWLQ